MTSEELQQEIRDLVVSRLMAIPPNLKLSIGSYGSFNNEQLVQHVKENDEVGRTVLNMQMSYLKSLKKRYR